MQSSPKNRESVSEMEYKFCFDDKRIRRATHDMILMMARHGNHGVSQRFVSDADVKRFFAARGYDWDDLVQTCRKPTEVVPFVENLLSSTWKVSSGRAAIVTGAATAEEKEITSVNGPGELTTSNYLRLFENAVDNLNKCLDSMSFGDFQSSISNGVASIDAYIAHRTWIYNSGQPAKELLDSKANQVSLDTKIDEWIPTMSGGKKLDKSGAD